MNIIRTTLKQKSSNLLVKAKRYSNPCDKCGGAGEELKKQFIIPAQVEDAVNPRRITIVGAASEIGKSIAYNFVRNRFCDELVLTDIPANQNKLCGTTLDLLHANCYFRSPHIKIGCDYSITAKSDLIVLCCGDVANEKVVKDIAQANVKALHKIVPCIALYSPDCVFIVLSYPVEITCYAVWKYSCFPKNRIVGIGTGLENSRFKYHVSTRIPVNPINVRTQIIGARDEAGELLIPIWNSLDVATTAFRDIDDCIAKKKDKHKWKELFDTVRNSHKPKGVNNWNIASYVGQISRDILMDSKTVHTVALRAKGIYNLDTEAFLSFPAVLGNRGIFEVIQQCLSSEEICQLQTAMDDLDKLWSCIKF